MVVAASAWAGVAGADALYAAALKDKHNGLYDRAARELTQALTLQPDHIGAAWTLGWIYAEKGDKAEAAAQFRRILRWVPGTTMAFEADAALARMGQSAFPVRADLSGIPPTAMAVAAQRVIEHASNPLWTAGGNLLVYTRLGMGICIAEADGTQPRLVGPGLRLVGLSDDGRFGYGVTTSPPLQFCEVNLLASSTRHLAAKLPGTVDRLLAAPGGKGLAVICDVPDGKGGTAQVMAFLNADGAVLNCSAPSHLAVAPTWAADGSKLLWAADGKVMVAGPDGADCKAVADGLWASWLTPSQVLVRGAKGDVSIMGADGSGAVALVETDKDLGISDTWASPSGKYVLYRENGRSYSVVDVATKRTYLLGGRTDPVDSAAWLAKSDMLVVGHRDREFGSEPLWELIDAAKPADFHPLVRDAFVWGSVEVAPDGRLACYWRGRPDSVKFAPSGSYRQDFSGELVVGATDNSARLPWSTVGDAAEGTSTGMAWSPRSDALVYWVPAKESIGVITLRAKKEAEAGPIWPVGVDRKDKTPAS
jgi:hypothetical protein